MMRRSARDGVTLFVVPAKAGTHLSTGEAPQQESRGRMRHMGPRFRGDDRFWRAPRR